MQSHPLTYHQEVPPSPQVTTLPLSQLERWKHSHKGAYGRHNLTKPYNSYAWPRQTNEILWVKELKRIINLVYDYFDTETRIPEYINAGIQTYIYSLYSACDILKIALISVEELFYFLYASDSFLVDNNYLKDEMAANVIEYRKLSSAGLWLSDWFEILAFLTNQMSNWGYSTPRLLAFSRASGGLLCSLWDIFLIGCRNGLVLVLRHLIEKHSRSDRYVASGNQALSEILLVISADFSLDSWE